MFKLKHYAGKLVTTLIAASSLSFIVTGVTLAEEETVETKIARAVSAAPSRISDGAKVVDTDGTVLREGYNGWTCMPGVALIPGDTSPMCNDAMWMAWLKAANDGVAFNADTIGFSYMLGGDAFVSNDDPKSTNPEDGTNWVQEGPHLMMLMPASMMKGLPGTPQGGPYTMWKGTGMDHVMVPIGNAEKIVMGKK